MSSRFRLYNSDGITLEYTFPLVQRTNAPQSPLRYINIEGVRGSGSLVIPAGTPSWAIEIEGILYIDGATETYDDLMAKIEELETAIPVNVSFYLRMYKTSTAYYNYKVKRTSVISYPESLRTDSQKYSVKLLVNAW